MKTLKQFYTVALLLFLVGLNSCIDCIEGEGQPVTESRAVVDFEVLILDCSADVEIRENLISEKNSVEVIAQENLLPYIKTTSEGKKLTVDIEGCINSSENIVIRVYTNGLQKIVHDGSGDIVSTNALKGDSFRVVHDGSGDIDLDFKGGELSIDHDGSGNVNITGGVKELEIDADGSGDVDCSELKADAVDVSSDGSGNVSITVKKSLSINLSGSGDVRYTGDPQDIEQHSDGSGSIVRLN